MLGHCSRWQAAYQCKGSRRHSAGAQVLFPRRAQRICMYVSLSNILWAAPGPRWHRVHSLPGKSVGNRKCIRKPQTDIPHHHTIKSDFVIYFLQLSGNYSCAPWQECRGPDSEPIPCWLMLSYKLTLHCQYNFFFKSLSHFYKELCLISFFHQEEETKTTEICGRLSQQSVNMITADNGPLVELFIWSIYFFTSPPISQPQPCDYLGGGVEEKCSTLLQRAVIVWGSVWLRTRSPQTFSIP